jgi:Ca-activated chloride channel homolog
MKELATICLLLSVVLASSGQTQNPYLRSANSMYKERKYDKAIPEYLKAKEINDKDAVINFNLGDAYYRKDNFQEAAASFDNVIADADENAIRQKAYYNKGVSLTKQSKLEESIESYKMAVKMDPADKDARINLQKALLELKKKMPPPPSEKKDEKKKKQENKDQQKKPPQSKLTKKQVEQLLKALQQREQQVQQKMQQRHRTAGQQEKDW